MGLEKNGHCDRKRPIARLAARQFGLVTRVQLLDCGITAAAIDTRLRRGQLLPAHRGVYWLAYPRTEPIALAAAGVLAAGRHAVLSHGSAAALWGLTKRWPRPPEITLVRGDRRPRGITTHISQTLTRADIRHERGIRTTSPGRTILDIAPGTPARALTRTINDARLRGLLHLDALRELVARNPHHPGTCRLAPFTRDTEAPTRSQFEDDFLPWARAHGLPKPKVNARVAGYEVDILFESEKVIVELDGWEFHRGRESFEGDRERDAATSAAGFLTYRLTRARFKTQPETEATRIHTILQERRPRTTPAEAQVARASGRSAQSTPARSG